jgi:hypothetical protein
VLPPPDDPLVVPDDPLDELPDDPPAPPEDPLVLLEVAPLLAPLPSWPDVPDDDSLPPELELEPLSGCETGDELFPHPLAVVRTTAVARAKTLAEL